MNVAVTGYEKNNGGYDLTKETRVQAEWEKEVLPVYVA